MFASRLASVVKTVPSRAFSSAPRSAPSASLVGNSMLAASGAFAAYNLNNYLNEKNLTLKDFAASAKTNLGSLTTSLLAHADEVGVSFDSYMIPDNEIADGQPRVLDVDARVVLPIETHTRFILSSTDVIHDWAVPSLGIKMDAMPGRLNQTSTLIERKGLFFGQCSELCGVYHGFMPIVVEAVELPEYLAWLLAQE
ncbi:Cupredoxin [Mrakia frigida]|uniref:cytochrome c oxidase subunit II n=1 Tax=Mrakia frigida TaxID=29902 RepID=UPI003FCC0450